MTTTPATLAADWKAAKPGDTLVLTGEFAMVKLEGRTFDPPLTIDARAATIIGFAASEVAGLNWIGGALSPNEAIRARDGVKAYGAGLTFTDCQHIAVSGVTATGPEERGGYGVSFSNSQFVSCRDSAFTRFAHGLLFGGCDDFEATGNRFADMSSDGLNFASSHRGLIAVNSFGGTVMYEGAHPDGIQGWSRPTKRVGGVYVPVAPCSDIVIRKNVIRGDTQGIGLFNHVRAGVDDGGFDRITIEDNDVEISAPQAIALYDGRDCIVTNNRVRTLDGSAARASINIVRPVNLTRSGNSVAAGAGKPTDNDPDAVLPVEPAPDPRDTRIVELEADLAKANADQAADLQAADDRESDLTATIAGLKAKLAQIARMAQP